MSQTIARPEARVGDVVVVSGHKLREPERKGEILEVLGDPQTPHFRIRWEDERQSLFYPGPDSTVKSSRRPGKKR